ncbi:MAG TPA: flagellar biosynthesis anti-sigma factor FlgM [Ruminiclostridium sp.]|nr:flagellar biosynthesis anti-sigma factor FlgM [Ruminiclostridium sp.]
MKISGDVYNVSKVYNTQNHVGAVNQVNSVKSRTDVISISDNAKDYQVVSKALKDVPDVRQEKIDEFKEVYQSGTYNVSGEEIVEKLGRAVIDKKA